MSFHTTGRHTDMTAPELTDETAFGALTERHRRELQVHCYRMLGSLEEAEDLTQETFLRAWRFRETYAGRASLRAWLYRIATNACLDALEKRPRTPTDDRRGAVAAADPGRRCSSTSPRTPTSPTPRSSRARRSSSRSWSRSSTCRRARARC